MGIIVFHPIIPGNGGKTQFDGPNLECRVDDLGALRVTGWKTDTQSGYAIFAPGCWTYACVSKPTT